MTDQSLALYSADQVRELDRMAIHQHGINGYELMERAATSAFSVMQARCPEAKSLVVVCGSGNNGGDGFVLARLAIQAGMQVTVYLIGDSTTMDGDAATALQSFRDVGGKITPFTGFGFMRADVYVDALFGTGLKREVTGYYALAINAINEAREETGFVLSVDIPSGLDATSGAVLGAAVRADCTVTFIGLKSGLYTGSGPEKSGEIVLEQLKVPDDIYERVHSPAERLDALSLGRLLPRRKRSTHKGDFGHVLVIGGDVGMSGSVRLAAEGAYRVGAGLVTVATRSAHAVSMTQARPEIMCAGVDEVNDLDPLVKRASVIAIGPGMGQGDWSRALFQRALASDVPIVVDADALNLLSRRPSRRENWILTPHPGEAARLLSSDSERVQADRLGAVQTLSSRYGGVVVLKGAGTAIHRAGVTPNLCSQGNPGMAVGGMGDLLTGVIAGLLAQGLGDWDAARLGVYIHARAGDLAAEAEGERGMMPSDLYPWLRRLVNFDQSLYA